jgi:hypothetical protein
MAYSGGESGYSGPEMGAAGAAAPTALEQIIDPSAPTAEGFSLSWDYIEEAMSKLPTDERDIHPLYIPEAGYVTEDKTKELAGGKVLIGSYYTTRASHRVGIYVPDGFDPEAKKPVVLMTSPLGTGAKGHNQEVATQMMQKGYAVIFKGPPRYYGPTLQALTLAEDANEMFGLVNAINQEGKLGEIEELILYGESQAAMKLYMELAIKDKYGYETVGAMPVAACYMRQINWKRPHRQIRRLMSMGTGALRVARNMSLEDVKKLRGTVSLKDGHHHVIVLPVLVSGETGQALDHIDPEQEFTDILFGRDGYSKPRRQAAEIEKRFPNAEVHVYPQYGHVDGIMSPETRMHRELMLFEIAKRYDMRSADVEVEKLDETTSGA